MNNKKGGEILLKFLESLYDEVPDKCKIISSFLVNVCREESVSSYCCLYLNTGYREYSVVIKKKSGGVSLGVSF